MISTMHRILIADPIHEQTFGQDLGRGRGVHAGGLRGSALAVLCGLDAPDFRSLSRAARLPLAVACPTILCPGGRGGAAVSASFPAGGAGSGLKPRRSDAH